MIFQTANAIDKILRHEKTQTRRIVKPEHRIMLGGATDNMRVLRVSRLTTSVYEVGKTYAVQPGRCKRCAWYYAYGQPVIMADDRQPDGTPYNDNTLLTIGYLPLRIRILAIRREDVRTISEDDLKSEGYVPEVCGAFYFWRAWASMHDQPVVQKLEASFEYRDNPGNYHPDQEPNLNRLLTVDLKARPANRYDAWALTFEMVE